MRRLSLVLFVLFFAFPLLTCNESGNNENGGGGATSELIGPEGGTVTSLDGKLTLTFPPGALSEDTQITIRKIDPAELPPEFEGIDVDSAYQLEPDGLQFAVPVTATLMVDEDPVQEDGNLETELALLLTSSDGELEFLENLSQEKDVDAEMTTVSGELNHFSLLVETRQGITFSLSGVPDTMAVGDTFDALVNVDKPGFVNLVFLPIAIPSGTGGPTVTYFYRAPIHPVNLPLPDDLVDSVLHLLPFIINDGSVQALQDVEGFTCDFPGNGFVASKVEGRLRDTISNKVFGVRVLLGKGVTCVQAGPTPTPTATPAPTPTPAPSPTPGPQTISASPKEININHIMGVTQCPTPGDPIKVTTDGPHPVQLNVMNELPFFNVTPINTMTSGGEATFMTAFPCSGFNLGDNKGSFQIQGMDTISGMPTNSLKIDVNVTVQQQ